MTKIDFIKKLLPGFLPLFIFILADEIWGTQIGLVVALIFGVLEFFWTYWQEKRLDGFILFDTFLLCALGAVSFLLENETFFMLKPALLETLFCLIVGYSAFSSKNLLFQMSARHLKDVNWGATQEKTLQKSLKKLFVLLAGHTLLTYYAAFFLSKTAWGFISGGLFYAIFVLYVLWEWLAKKNQTRKLSREEWLPLVNREGQIIGKAPRSLCHKDKNLLHPVVHMHVFNQKGELLLQKRADHKETQPGKWDSAVGGHVGWGESLKQALSRETLEEIGLRDFQERFLGTYLYESETEAELSYLFVTQANGPFVFDPLEISEGRFFKRKELEQLLHTELITTNLKQEFTLIKGFFT